MLAMRPPDDVKKHANKLGIEIINWDRHGAIQREIACPEVIR
jgi:hypothetical protein